MRLAFKERIVLDAFETINHGFLEKISQWNLEPVVQDAKCLFQTYDLDRAKSTSNLLFILLI
jgi:hypothetical protein